MKLTTLLAAATVALAPTIAGASHDPEAAKNALMHAHHKMMEAMQSLEPTGDADKDFVNMMIPHHQGAIDAAKVELEFGHDEKLRLMAQEIIAAQEKEIAEMKEWLEAHP